MFRSLIPLAVTIVIVLGCKKKDEPVGGGSDGKVDSDPAATYTVKIRDDQAGDKSEVVETVSGTTDINLGAKSERTKEERRYEYTEHIIDFPAGANKPTKLTRTYKTARKHDKASNGQKAAQYEGKTVSIQKKGAAYEFTADGKKLDVADAIDFNREFGKADKNSVRDILPKSAVKVGESWTIDVAALKTLMSGMPFPVDASKSKLTGKLSRAYTKDGKQWGVLAFDFNLAIDSAVAPKASGTTTGSIKIDGLMDAVIDGSSRDGTMRLTIKMDMTGKQGAAEMKVVADTVQEKTVKSLK